MTQGISVVASVRGSSIEVEASYPEYAVMDAGFDEPFRQTLIEKYEGLARNKDVNDCILSIKASVAGSQVVKGIFELYKTVRARSGILLCAEYPPDYVRALTDLGLPALPGFWLCGTLDEAREKLKALREEKP